MPTNEERQEIAENLRIMAIRGQCKWAEQFYELLKETVMDSWDFHEFGDVADRLADLIEPEPERTCRNVAEQGILFECSECGAKTVDAVGNYTQEYCAACGRKVQDAD